MNDLLDVAKMETGHLTVARTELALPPLLRDIAWMWADKARTKGLTFELDLSGCPDRIVEDGDRLRQILFNLLSNAVKFTERGSVRLSVEVDPASEGERLRLKVTDTGIGISEDDFERVFDSFTQLDGGRARQHAGTGLGLTICRNLAEAMGGSIALSSRLGAGSVFTIDLPLHLAPALGADEMTRERGLSFSRLLVVEDNPLAQSMLRAVLQSKVARLDFATSLDAAAEANPPSYDRIIVDGACLSRAHSEDPIRALHRFAAKLSVPLTALWPSPGAGDVARLNAIGVDQILAKPISADALVASLTMVLNDRPAPDESASDAQELFTHVGLQA